MAQNDRDNFDNPNYYKILQHPISVLTTAEHVQRVLTTAEHVRT